MTLLNLVQEKGLAPKWVAHTQSGEYHSPCPACGGNDRFVIHPNKQMKNCIGSYFCRRCNTHGDTIQFCIDYLGLNFKAAVAYIGLELADKRLTSFTPAKSRVPIVIISKPSAAWMQQALVLVEQAHINILSEQEVIEGLAKRGLSLAVIKQYKIGWIPEDKKVEGHLWGLNQETVWLPAGIAIPIFEQDQAIRLKIRRKDWQPDDKLPKYAAVSGSMRGLNIIGNKKHLIIIIVESELDAYVLHYFVGDFAVIVAIGGCTKDPDPMINHLVRNKTAFICHDNDGAGKAMLDKWQRMYPHARAYPTPFGKDIGEAFQQGLDLRKWILNGLSEQIQCELGLIKSPSWSSDDQALIDWILQYISEQVTIRTSYAIFEKEIALGPDSPRAKTGELQEGLRLMKYLIELDYGNRNLRRTRMP